MSAPRSRRLPVSCEPCRIRKIRCTRDTAPCGTCRRRAVTSECRYTKRPSDARYSGDVSGVAPVSPISSAASNAASGQGDRELADRVKKLEQLLQAQSQGTYHSSTPGITPLARSHYSENGDQASEDDLRGTLRTTESGHLRFIPQHAGWEPCDAAPNHDNSISSYPFGNRTKPLQELLQALPSTEACSTLVRTYFASFASLFHILHTPTFHEQYASFLDDPESMPLAWIALLYAILAIASIALPIDSQLLGDLSRQRKPFVKMAELSQRYRDMAMRCLEADHFLWNHSVTTLQALIVLIYGISHTHGPTWTLVGLAHHLALSIGCHVDPDNLALDAIESEERRRCWSGLMMLYTSQDTSLGHLGLPHTAFRGNSKPPADIDDEDLTAGVSSAPGRATQMTYLLLKFRLYDICSAICDKVLAAPTPQLDMIWQVDAAIQQERSLLEMRYSQDTMVMPLPVYQQAHVTILHMYSNHLTLLLHHSNAMGACADNSRQHWSRQRSLESARHILRGHQKLNESPELAPFRWYGRGLGSFHAFQAAVTLVTLVQSTIETNSQDYQMLQAVRERFESMAELSIICAKAAPALRQLLSKLPTSASFQPSPISLTHHEQDTAARPSSYGPPFQQQNSIPDSNGDWDAILSQFQPPQWLTHANLPWEHWNETWLVS